jgi:hypothetical protein
MKPNQVRRAYSVECHEDGNLVVHKDADRPVEAARIVVILSFPVEFGVWMLLAALLPNSPLGSRQAGVGVPVGLSFLVLGPALAWALNRRVRRDVWQIDGRGVAFLPRTGPESRVDWKDVQWVKWGRRRVVLLGEGGRVALDQGDLSRDDWLMVRDRVETMLSGRFDLTTKRLPKSEASLVRILGLATPLGVLTLLLMHCLKAMPPKLMAAALIAYLFVMLGVPLFLLTVMDRGRERLNPTWRAAKSKGLGWDDW